MAERSETLDIAVHDAPERHRYEAVTGGSGARKVAGFAEYRDSGERRTFTHTVVSDAFEGRGVGSRLAKAALDDVRARGMTVRPLCPFIASWIQRHPEYADLLAE